MDKYRKVMKPKETVVKDESEIRLTATGGITAYVARAAKVYGELEKSQVVLKATGNALTKAVTLAEVIKRRFKGLHQITSIGNTEIVDEYEPLEEGLDKVTDTRSIPFIEITLSKEPLDTADKGYQPPIDESLVSEFDPEKIGKGRGRGRGRGKGRGKGKGKSKSKGKAEAKGKSKGKGKGKGKAAEEPPPKGKGKGKGKEKGKDKGKGKGKAVEEPPKGKGKGKSKGKGKGKAMEEEPPKGKGKKGKGKGKMFEEPPPKGKGKKGKSKGYDVYEPPSKGKGKKGPKGASKGAWSDDYGYGKSSGKGKGKKGKGKKGY